MENSDPKVRVSVGIKNLSIFLPDSDLELQLGNCTLWSDFYHTLWPEAYRVINGAVIGADFEWPDGANFAASIRGQVSVCTTTCNPDGSQIAALKPIYGTPYGAVLQVVMELSIDHRVGAMKMVPKSISAVNATPATSNKDYLQLLAELDKSINEGPLPMVGSHLESTRLKSGLQIKGDASLHFTTAVYSSFGKKGSPVEDPVERHNLSLKESEKVLREALEAYFDNLPNERLLPRKEALKQRVDEFISTVQKKALNQ